MAMFRIIGKQIRMVALINNFFIASLSRYIKIFREKKTNEDIPGRGA